MSSNRPLSYASALSGRPSTSQQNREHHPPDKASALHPTASTTPPTAGRPTERTPCAPPHPRRTSPPPQTFHTPRTSSPEQAVYVLTLTTTPSIHGPINTLRKRYFPQHLNRTPAHLTLFHALPHSRLETLTSTLETLCTSTAPFAITTGAPFRMRRGVGVNVGRGAEQAKRVHRELREAWMEFLSEQDAGGWKPHWTVQNKVDSEEEAAGAYEEVRGGFKGAEGMATGVGLWKYVKGRWVFEREFGFGGEEGG
ncbi:hypothetical protein H2201_003293 [Coniosporium apollinis]|uniref:Phosphoesterase HXTX domain-containing protein n=1 Tax=Coniosporium apollinis TaxID=61459 RepID=A0ABQ9NZC6_9PEZI|nr:hypothetical protein H2201_003293 [Coniosporium apollinis]